MNIPIPSRIIRLVFREIMLLTDSDQSFNVKIALLNSTMGCPFGREMVERSFNALLNEQVIQIEQKGVNLLASLFSWTSKKDELLHNGNFEEVFKKYITERKFYFYNIGEYRRTDMYGLHQEKWELFSEEEPIDEETNHYFEISRGLTLQLWEDAESIKIASRYLGHRGIIKIKKGILLDLNITLYKKPGELSTLELSSDDTNFKGLLMSFRFNEDYHRYEIENHFIPEIAEIFDCKLNVLTIYQ